MKKILYRNSISEYESGIFISFKTSVSILIIICLIICSLIFTSDLSIWYQLFIFLFFAIIVAVFSDEYNYGKIDLKRDAEFYIDKISKNKSKLFEIPNKIIGEYEFNSIIQNPHHLIKFYSECLAEIEKTIKNDKKTNNGLLKLLYEDFEEKIYHLKKVERFEGFSDVVGDNISFEEYLLRKKSILKKNQKLINELEQLILVSNKIKKIYSIDNLHKIKEKSEESYNYLKLNI